MISVLITLLVLCLIAGIIWWALGLIPLPPMARNIVGVVFAIILLLWLLQALPLGVGIHPLWR